MNQILLCKAEQNVVDICEAFVHCISLVVFENFNPWLLCLKCGHSCQGCCASNFVLASLIKPRVALQHAKQPRYFSAACMTSRA